MNKKLREKISGSRPFQLFLVLCGAILFYMLISNIKPVLSALKFIGGAISPVLSGAVIAYLLFPIVRFFRNRVFGKMKNRKLAHLLSVIITMIIFAGLLILLIYMVIPELAQSVVLLVDNVETYTSDVVKKAEDFLAENSQYMEQLGLSSLDLSRFDWKNIIVKTVQWLGVKSEGLIGAGVSAGKKMMNSFIAVMFTIYILLDVDTVTRSLKRYIKSLLPKDRLPGFSKFCVDSNKIFMQYFGGNLLDSLIVGALCFFFMKIMRLPYAPLITVVVAVTNFIPTFGPIIGLVISSFLIVLVNPLGALWFVIYTALSQSCDAYIIKPILFGDSTGLSPLWVLASIIIGGGLFGMAGMLLGVPVAGIISTVITDRVKSRLVNKGYETAEEQIPE